MSRDLHLQIRSRIEAELGGRPWTWLAKVSGVPTSTLSNQVNRPRFSLDVLSRVAKALGKDLTYFIQAPSPPDERSGANFKIRISGFGFRAIHCGPSVLQESLTHLGGNCVLAKTA